jgi:hypothetical protein
VDAACGRIAAVISADVAIIAIGVVAAFFAHTTAALTGAHDPQCVTDGKLAVCAIDQRSTAAAIGMFIAGFCSTIVAIIAWWGAIYAAFIWITGLSSIAVLPVITNKIKRKVLAFIIEFVAEVPGASK